MTASAEKLNELLDDLLQGLRAVQNEADEHTERLVRIETTLGHNDELLRAIAATLKITTD